MLAICVCNIAKQIVIVMILGSRRQLLLASNCCLLCPPAVFECRIQLELIQEEHISCKAHLPASLRMCPRNRTWGCLTVVMRGCRYLCSGIFVHCSHAWCSAWFCSRMWGMRFFKNMLVVVDKSKFWPFLVFFRDRLLDYQAEISCHQNRLGALRDISVR